jgi:hypothetical protein
MNLSKFKIWLIPALIVILALMGLVFLRGRVSEKAPTTEQPETVQGQEATGPKGFAKPPEPTPQMKAKLDSEAMVGALDSGKLSDCDKITWSEEIKKQCQDNLNYAASLKSNDKDQCSKLNDKTLKTQCYDKIYMTTAVDSKDPSVCEKISVASLKQMCLDQVQMILSRYADSVDDCSVISSESLRKQCENNFYMQSSAKTRNITGCSSITDPELQAQCKKTVTTNIQVVEQSKKAAENAVVAKTLREILSLCDDLTGNKSTTCKDAIYPQLAFDEKNLTYCTKISDPEKVTECQKDQGDKINAYYLRQSLASNDKTICNQIQDSELKQLCQNS